MVQNKDGLRWIRKKINDDVQCDGLTYFPAFQDCDTLHLTHLEKKFAFKSDNLMIAYVLVHSTEHCIALQAIRHF